MKLLYSLFIVIIFNFKSFAYPMKDIYFNLDITSFDSSLKPMITNLEKRLPEFKELPAPRINDDSIIIEDPDWIYKLTVIKQTGDDYNVCFIDQAKQSSYMSQSPMIIRKYGHYYVAINSQSNACDKYAK